MSEMAPPIAPYKGLMPYAEEDAPFFFGREVEREIIVANLMASRLTLLYGPSGVGKSSVLRAGVAHHLRQLAEQNLAEHGTPEFAVVMFSSWRDDPLPALADRIHDSVAEALNVQTLAPVPPSRDLSQTLPVWTERLKGDLLIIFDQFEEYFLYHPQEDGEGTFATEFPRAVNRADLRVSFLISIREDALAKLDRFKGRIPNLFDNYLRVKHLDREAAHAAIEKPIDEYNRLYAINGPKVSIEPALVETVLRQVKAGQVVLGQAGRGMVGEKDAEEQIETPYLQLVMTRLWDEEMRAGSSILQLETLQRLGGAERIVRTHLDAAMSALPPDEQDVAARVFHYLVTPSGTKIAHTAPDLSEYAKLPPTQLTPILETLSGGEVRILRPTAPPPDQPAMPRYEIFHDVLAAAILDWRARYVQEQDRTETARQLASARQRVTRLRVGLAGLCLLLMLMAGLAIFAFQQRNAATQAQADANARRLEAVAAQEEAKQHAEQAEQHALLSTSRELAAAAVNNLDTDPERSVLLALRAAAVTYSVNKTITAEAEDALHRALQASRIRLTLSGHTNEVSGVAFSPDGTRLATASWDKTAKVWDVSSGQELLTLSGHTDTVFNVAFSPDGTRLATASADNSAKVWDAASGRELLTLSGHTDTVVGVTFSPDGMRLATASGDMTARVYALNIEDLMRLARRRITRSLTFQECRKYLHEEQQCPLAVTALNQVVEGNNLARAGEVDSAVASFRSALERDATLRLDPEADARRLAAEALVGKGQSLAKAGEVDSAVASFRSALELDPTLRLDPEAEARRLTAEALVGKGSLLVRQSKVKEAIAAYAGAEKLHPTLKIPAKPWNTLCWFGSLWKQAGEVMFACERAVQLEPENWRIRESRGVARAMTGEIHGAIEDFQEYIQKANDAVKKSQRQRWVDSLRAGEDPFTDEEIKTLFYQ